MSGEQKLKKAIKSQSRLKQPIIQNYYFTNQATVYKTRANEFSDTKASVLGDYVAAKLGMEEDEAAIYMAATKAYEGFMIFILRTVKLQK